MEYELKRIFPFDREAAEKNLALLTREGITADRNLEYTVGLFTPSGELVASGSYFKNTLRCLAVDSRYRGEGLLNALVSHLTGELAARGVFELFLYTKYNAARYFADLGFYTVAEVDRQVVFMENVKGAFDRYLAEISARKVAAPRVGAIVMNANPFTLGHQYLAEKAAGECGVLHLFVVREDVSAFPYAVRDRLIRQGTAHLSNVVYHHTGNYVVSSATFPSYFIRDTEEVTRAHARVDAAVFARIARALGVTVRYVGDEPFSFATNLYNETMAECLPAAGVELVVIPRREDEGLTPISASRVREKLLAWDLEGLKPLVPETTWAFLASEEGKEVAERMRSGGAK